MIALLVNYVEADANWYPHVIGIFNDESEISDEYKRTEYYEDEIWRDEPKIKRFLNLEESKKLNQNPEILREHLPSLLPFYSVKEIKVGEIFDWEL